jgi:hypothetical protein
VSTRVRSTLLALVAAGALATAGSAWASFSPKLTIGGGAATQNGSVTVSVSTAAADDPTARLSIFIPRNWQVTTGQAIGTKLGTVTGTASAADLAGATLQLAGDLDVTGPNPAAQSQCGVNAVATWVMHLSAAGQTIDIPMFVATTQGSEVTIGPYKLVVCLPPPDVPTGTPGRAVFGAKLLSATLSTSAITSPGTPGEFRWTSLWTPYNPGKGTPDIAGSVETQSLVRVPTLAQISVKRTKVVRNVTVKVKGKKVTRRQVSTRVAYQTKVSESGQPLAGAKVTARAAGKVVGTGTTNAAGVVSGTFTLTKGSATLAVTATVPTRDLGSADCMPTSFFGVACVDATVAGSVHTASVKVTAYK